ncbi:serine hydrolase-domain-containing protein [Xylaria flabelliformis]|nr:serine hydrolase-domain-containing protein [Xylaria flabelliformis]
MNFSRLPLYRFTSLHIRRFHRNSAFMAGAEQPAAAAPATQDKKSGSNIPKGKKELKILMLHGYTQSGPLFSAKTKALNKLLIKALSPAPLNLHPTLIFPTGPHRLRPSDIPGYVPPEVPQGDEDDLDNWSWFRKDEASGQYRGIDDGMRRVASTIQDAGGVDGVIGFSQGGCMAALVAAALEHPHHTPSSSTPSPDSSSETPDWSWLSALRTANADRPLKFCVVYSGFWAPPQGLQWLYEPAITTPTLHFLGGLDTVVEEKRSQALIERCRDPMVLTHPGGHYVPVARDWVMPLAGWLRQRCVAASDEAVKETL